MQPFLDKVAEHVLLNHTHGLENVALITPNRRAGLFLKKYFAKRVTAATWAPDVLSMEDFIHRITGISIQEPVALLLHFYQVYCQSEGEKAEPLEDFLKWAPLIIKDFNDIDAHLSDPDKLFENVVDVKRIETWNPDGKPMTDFQKNYVEFFSKFHQWHQSFTKYLLNNHSAYQGLAYRVAAQNISGNNKLIIPWKYIYFTGFNALNDAEEIIIKTLIKNKRAEILWDADKYYLDNRHHEAGMFLRKYNQSWNLSPISFTGDHFNHCEKKIHIYGVAKNVNQARLAANVLKTIPADSLLNHQTAVVLASEDLLLPVLNSIPQNIRQVNITMGYPIKKTNIYALFDSIFLMHITTQRMKSDREKWDTAFYFKDLVRFFGHPAISLLSEQNHFQLSTEDLNKRIFKSKKTFLTSQTLTLLRQKEDGFTQLFAPFLAGFSKEPLLIIPALKKLVRLLENAYARAAENDNSTIDKSPWLIDYESLFTINAVLNKLEGYQQNQVQVTDVRILYMLFQSLCKESKLILSGEPLAGLQIMGMLETRNLDFKNLIILSANEDILPASKSSASLIPYDVKSWFGMHSFKEKDAIFAYHFYRLIQRAENIHIIYNTQSQSIGSSEKSRFITQLQMEMPLWNPKIVISEKIVPLPAANDRKFEEVAVPKTIDILQKIALINEKGFSPSTLRHYIQCPLLFYFRHIAGIEETVVPEEIIQSNTLGTVIHESLEFLYNSQNLEGQQIMADHIQRMIKMTDEVIRKKFEEVYSGGDIHSGKNLLLAKVAAKFVRNFLSCESKYIQELNKSNRKLFYLKSEDQLTATIDVEINGNVMPVKFRGFADRIDRVDNLIRIIDYKTGHVETRDLKIKDWSEITGSIQYEKPFQLMMYALLYKYHYDYPHEVQPGIFALKKPASGLHTLEIAGKKNEGRIEGSDIGQFKQQLAVLVNEIFDPHRSFLPTTEEKNCLHCNFKSACHRSLSNKK
jgi:ATP-dependent helicase/nuclease subunit B